MSRPISALNRLGCCGLLSGEGGERDNVRLQRPRSTQLSLRSLFAAPNRENLCRNRL